MEDGVLRRVLDEKVLEKEVLEDGVLKEETLEESCRAGNLGGSSY